MTPYILSESRTEKDRIIDDLFTRCKGRGDVNYCCTRLVHLWALQQLAKINCLSKKYDILNDAYGILSSAASEFYCAVVHPYEILKRKLNGAVSRLDAYPDGKVPEQKVYCTHCRSCKYDTNEDKCLKCGCTGYRGAREI